MQYVMRNSGILRGKRPTSTGRREYNLAMLLVTSALLSLIGCAPPCRAAGADDVFDVMIKTDWAMQET
jgi:hypothetical protein